MNYKELPSFEELWELFEYAPLTGKLYWKIRPSKAVKVGDEAGCVTDHNYITVKIKGKIYKAHRLIYKMMTGKDPGQYHIDHKDGECSYNVWWKLRIDRERRNQHNRKLCSRNKTGVTGVQYKKRIKRFISSISYKGKSIHLGYFEDFDDAVTARKEAEEKYFGEWARSA